jgi:hypothetical protein
MTSSFKVDIVECYAKHITVSKLILDGREHCMFQWVDIFLNFNHFLQQKKSHDYFLQMIYYIMIFFAEHHIKKHITIQIHTNIFFARFWFFTSLFSLEVHCSVESRGYLVLSFDLLLILLCLDSKL